MQYKLSPKQLANLQAQYGNNQVLTDLVVMLEPCAPPPPQPKVLVETLGYWPQVYGHSGTAKVYRKVW